MAERGREQGRGERQAGREGGGEIEEEKGKRTEGRGGRKERGGNLVPVLTSFQPPPHWAMSRLLIRIRFLSPARASAPAPPPLRHAHRSAERGASGSLGFTCFACMLLRGAGQRQEWAERRMKGRREEEGRQGRYTGECAREERGRGE
eukprot:760437-Hanusia_phi.AAC.1